MSEHTDTSERQTPVVEFYWRPGCPFCLALRAPLRRSGLPLREVNIWQDEAAAARVRSVAEDNETVPTVFVGQHAMVNPGIGQVLAAVGEHAPHLAGSIKPKAPRWQPPLVTIAAALLWALLAARDPATAFPLAPLLVSAAWPLTHRWLSGTPLRPGLALGLVASGLAVSLATTAVLARLGMLGGPQLTGGGDAVTETLLVAVIGAALGWWVARRRNRG